jgi:hypothetical protein
MGRGKLNPLHVHHCTVHPNCSQVSTDSAQELPSSGSARLQKVLWRGIPSRQIIVYLSCPLQLGMISVASPGR